MELQLLYIALLFGSLKSKLKRQNKLITLFKVLLYGLNISGNSNGKRNSVIHCIFCVSTQLVSSSRHFSFSR